MSDSTEHIDKPEPRWQALVALLAVGAIVLALPRSVIIGPIWLVPTLIVVLLVPTVVSHRVGKRSLNRALGIIINGITTTALIGSVILLVRAAFTSGSAIAALALRRATLADERDRLRTLVLAARWPRAHRAPRAKEIRQHQLSFPADADPT